MIHENKRKRDEFKYPSRGGGESGRGGRGRGDRGRGGRGGRGNRGGRGGRGGAQRDGGEDWNEEDKQPT